MMKRLVMRGVAGVLVAAGLLFAGIAVAPAASAATPLTSPPLAAPLLPDCKNAPVPEVPGRGVVGFFDQAPATPPAAGNPFTPGSSTTILEQYGYSGLRFNTYDLGCGPEVARAPDAAIGTTIANWIFEFSKTAVAATGALVNAAFNPTFLGVFDPLITNVVASLRSTVFDQWAGLVVAAIGFLIVWRARRAAMASTAAAIGWALFVMVVATVVFQWPLAAGHAADASLTTVLGKVSGGLGSSPTASTDPGTAGTASGTPGTTSGSGSENTSATANLHSALLYQAWLGGTFGDANSTVARRYGSELFDAQALTWREAAVLRDNPRAGQAIIDAKQQKYKAVAAKVLAEDPDAYQYLTGNRSDARVGYAVLSGVATLCAVPFLIFSALLIIGALVIVRFAIMLFPAFATLGLFPTMRPLITTMGNTVAAAMINSAIFGIGAAITVKGLGVIMAPATALPAWLVVVLDLLLTVVMWFALRPFRRLTEMISPGHNPFAVATGAFGTAGRGALRMSGRVVGAAIGSYAGASAAGQHATAAGNAEGGTSGTGSRGSGSVGGTVPERAEGTLPGFEPAPEPGLEPAAEPVPSGAIRQPIAEATPNPRRINLFRSGPSAAPPSQPVLTPAALREPAQRESTLPPSTLGAQPSSEPGYPQRARAHREQVGAWHPAATGSEDIPDPVEVDDLADAPGREQYVIYRPRAESGADQLDV